MNRAIISVLCLLWILVASGCGSCKRYVKYQQYNVEVKGIKVATEEINVPTQIGNTKIPPINIGQITIHSDKVREASDIIQILDNGQYRDCQLIERLPKDQQAQFMETMMQYNHRMDGLSAILTLMSRATSTEEGKIVDHLLTEWISKEKNELNK